MLGGVIAAALVLATGLPAFATVTSTTLTINGSGSTANLGPFTYSYSGTGTAALTGFGSASFRASGGGVYFNSVSGPTGGSFILDFGGGNTMTGTFSLPGNVLAPNLLGTVFPLTPVSFSIGAGTGVYAGALGTFANISGNGTATASNSATFTLAAVGAVTLPGIPATPAPATLPLTVTGLGTAYFLDRMWASRNKAVPSDPRVESD